MDAAELYLKINPNISPKLLILTVILDRKKVDAYCERWELYQKFPEEVQFFCEDILGEKVLNEQVRWSGAERNSDQ